MTLTERSWRLIGRDEELAVVGAFVDRAEDGFAALTLEGEAGIGKSTLWLAAVERARSRGLRVLMARPAEAELPLAHAGLGDLFENALGDVLGCLSLPRRRALEGAVLLEDAQPRVVDPRALGIAVRDALQVLAEQGPPVVAIDDLQWLDPASAGALAFALRRVDGSPVRLLLTRRVAARAAPSELERALPEANVRRLVLGPLSVGALHAFLRDRLDRVFARQTLLRIHEHSAGNPFYALEIARMLPTDLDRTQPLPVPEALDELVRGRVSGLPASTRAALALAAAVRTPSASMLERAGVVPEVLEPAIEAGVITRDHGAIRFTHPLLASVAYDASVHGRLVTLVEDPLARARHLALSTESPREDVARTVEQAARLAMERGAAALAAELGEHALRLTPATDADRRHRRALATARAHRTAGEWTRARDLARVLLNESGPGPERADILVLLAEFEVDEQAVPLLEDALTEAVGRPELHLEIRIQLALSRRFISGFRAAFDDARTALAEAEALDDDTLRVSALATAAFLGRTGLAPEPPAYAVAARKIADRSGDPQLLKRSATVLGQVLLDRGDYEAARASLERDHDAWCERDERFAAELLWTLAWLELWSGNLERAAGHAARSQEIAAQYGVDEHPQPLPGAWTAAYRGQLELARELAERGLALCRKQIHVAGPLFPGVLGLVAFWGGDAASGAAHFMEADRLAEAVDWRNPHNRPWTPHHVEALLELGRIDQALQVLDRWEADAALLGLPRIFAQVTRCRGLIAAVEHRVDDAAALLEEAVVAHGQLGDRFGRARALLALGVVRRRQRQKGAARSTLEDALQAFIDLGAPMWIERARAELGRIGGRTREPGLTAAERRVAALVAQGRTNREVASALFLGERTVETHLTHVYAKLDVRSRAQLARVYHPDTEGAGQSSGGSAMSS
jgi:DNA-binding CsgD family transcriptional regulator